MKILRLLRHTVSSQTQISWTTMFIISPLYCTAFWKLSLFIHFPIAGSNSLLIQGKAKTVTWHFWLQSNASAHKFKTQSGHDPGLLDCVWGSRMYLSVQVLKAKAFCPRSNPVPPILAKQQIPMSFLMCILLEAAFHFWNCFPRITRN